MTITVTQADIDSGCRKLNHSCPVALAILRQVPNLTACVANTQRITLFAKNWMYMFESAPAWRFIQAFDQGRTVSPFSFDIPLSLDDILEQQRAARLALKRERAAAYMARVYRERRAAGVCVRCRTPTTSARCAVCAPLQRVA